MSEKSPLRVKQLLGNLLLRIGMWITPDEALGKRSWDELSEHEKKRILNDVYEEE